jgi:hypothetical protein
MPNFEINPIDLLAVPFFLEGASALMHGEITTCLLAYGIGGAILYAVHARGNEISAALRRFGSNAWGIFAIICVLLVYIASARIAREITGYANGSIQQIANLTNRLNQANTLANQLRGQITQAQSQLGTQKGHDDAELKEAQSKIDALNKQIADCDQNLAHSQAAANDWQQRYVDVIIQIAGHNFAESLFNAQFQTDTYRALAGEADAELASAQTRWEKKLIPMPPRSSQEHAQEAHTELNQAQANLEHWNSMLKAMITSAIACTKK